ncbi:MAG: hypothetical protein JSS81_12035 [Acidobacteria bacterium]|nr:hypothetical protein [Acidobacteriota bacterium]
MLKKFSLMFVLAASCVVLMPATGAAFDSAEKSPAAIEYKAGNSATPQRRREWRRWQNRRWNRRWRRTGRVRVIRQVYYRNGRRYVRYIRIYR